MKNKRDWIVLNIVSAPGTSLIIDVDTEANEAVVMGYESADGLVDLVIPKDVEGYPITRITRLAFASWDGLRKIVLPNTVTTIGDQAFSFCTRLISVKIPSSVRTIGESAFDNCRSLKAVWLPDSVTSLGIFAFCDCQSLRKIRIPRFIKSFHRSILLGCSNLSSIVVSKRNTVLDSRNNCNAIIETKSNMLIVGCSGTVIPDSITTISSLSFFISNVREIILPNTVTTLNQGAFDGCYNLQKVVISDSVTTIDQPGFGSCPNLSKIQVSAKNKVFDSRHDCNSIIRTQDNALISGCKSTVIPKSVLKIGPHALEGCNMAKVKIPRSVVAIESMAFARCANLSEITIPNSVLSIGPSAFTKCERLTTVSIPQSTLEISGAVFSDCIRLSSISVDRKNRRYDSRNRCNAIIETETNTLIQGCWQTRIPDSIVEIGPYAFSGFPCLISIALPDSVVSIDECAFLSCRNLASVVLPDSLRRIESSAFQGCSSLVFIEIPASVKEVGESVFRDCDALRTIIVYETSILPRENLPEDVTIILKKK